MRLLQISLSLPRWINRSVPVGLQRLKSNFYAAATVISIALARPPTSSSKDYSKKQLLFNFIVGISLVLLVIAVLFEPIWISIQGTANSAPEINLESVAWKILYRTEKDCSLDCVLDRANFPLNKAQTSLADADFTSRVRQLRGQTFWTGFSLNQEFTRKIAAAQASTLIVGHVNAQYTLFVNGSKRQTGTGNDFVPVQINLTPSDLDSDLQVALKIDHNLGSSFPIAVNSPMPTGFFTNESARNFRDTWISVLVIKPLALGLSALLASVIFFGLWLSVRERNEYLIFALFTLCFAAIQALSWGTIKFGTDRGLWYKINFILMLCEGVLAGFLGASYARTRISTYVFFIGVAGLLGAISNNSVANNGDYVFLSAQFAKTFVPFCFWCGAALCLSQSWIGASMGFKKMASAKNRRRVFRLRAFAAILILVGLVYMTESYKITALVPSSFYWPRAIQLICIGGIGWFLLRDFREFDILHARTHFSRFHDVSSKEGTTVTGYLLEVDMKASSRLYDLSADLGLIKEIPSIWNETAVQTVAEYGGEILSTEGDAFRAFFESKSDIAPPEIFSALATISDNGQKLESYGHSIHFRAAILKGSIKPVYKEIGGKWFEDYDHGPKETCFKDASRFLRTEKNISLPGNIIVVEPSMVTLADFDKEIFIVRKREKLFVDDVGHKELLFIEIQPGLREKLVA